MGLAACCCAAVAMGSAGVTSHVRGLKDPTDVLAADAGIVGDETLDRRLADDEQCKDIQVEGECEDKYRCKWNGKKCKTRRACKYIFDEDRCDEKDDCKWRDGECKKKDDGPDRRLEIIQCPSIDNTDDCTKVRHCKWKNNGNRCVTKCGKLKKERKCRQAPDECVWDGEECDKIE